MSGSYTLSELKGLATRLMRILSSTFHRGPTRTMTIEKEDMGAAAPIQRGEEAGKREGLCLRCFGEVQDFLRSMKQSGLTMEFKQNLRK